MSSTELEALVGYLFVVGGRSVRAASPGAAAVPPPRRAARGRDGDTLFCVISLSEDQHQPAAYYEELVGALSGTYFETPGGVTSALREGTKAINAAVLRQPASPGVGLACAVLREHELYLALAGQARAFMIKDEGLERLPSDEEMLEGTPPLGHFTEPDVRYFRREVRSGDLLILSDGALNRLSTTTLLYATETGSVDTTLGNLASVAGDFASAQVIKFVEAAEAPPGGGVSAPPAARSPLLNLPRSIFGMPAEGEPPPTAEPSAPAPEPAAPMGEPPAEKPARRAQHAAASGLAEATARVRLLIERALPEDRGGNPLEGWLNLPIGAQAAVAAGVAVLVALLTSSVYRFYGQNFEYVALIEQARAQVEQGRAASGQAQARPHWENAVFLLDEAARLRAPSAEMIDLRQEALGVLDGYDQVTRVETILLRAYDPGTVLRGPVVQGPNLFVLDTTADIFYREDLDQSGTALVNRAPQIVTRQGEQVGGQVVGGLIDLEWVPEREALVVLSRNGLLIQYSPSRELEAGPLPSANAWVDPRAIDVLEGDVFVLDAGANQVLRYQATDGLYIDTPQPYFTEQTPDLSSALDLEIDSNGNLFILRADGSVAQYFQGRDEGFSLNGLPQPPARPAALFLNASVFDRSLYIADPGGGRLYTTGLNGQFLSSYKDAENTVFEAVSGVFAGDGPQVYVTSGSRLYYFIRP